MAKVFLIGHGGWSVIGKSSVFTSLPKGTTLSVYSPIGNVIKVSEAKRIIGDSPMALQPDQVFESYQGCPDTTLAPVDSKIKAALEGANRFPNKCVFVNSRTQLADLVQQYGGHDLHWIACRVRLLR